MGQKRLKDESSKLKAEGMVGLMIGGEFRPEISGGLLH
jgi:hypothetical protein